MTPAPEGRRFNVLLVSGVVCLVAGALLLYLGEKLSLPTLGPASILLGAAFLLAGTDSVVRRTHASGSAQEGNKIVYSGTAAAAWGLCLALFGVGLVTVGVAKLLGAGDAGLAFLRARPGIAILWLGLLLLATGRGMMGAWRRGSGAMPPWYTLLPGRIGGSLVVALGALACLVGVFEIVLPAAFDAGGRAVLDAIEHAVAAVLRRHA